MSRSIETLRHDYGNTPLNEEDLASDPIRQFQKWLREAIKAQVFEPNGMTLSTLSDLGEPSARTVLLKGVDTKGFTFFTNYHSRKGEQLVHHPAAALTFWWKEIYRQVSIEGNVKKVSRQISRAYFAKRPRGAQLAAVASAQSEPLASRLEIEETYARLKKKYAGKSIPCPTDWGGYILTPDRIEFWQGRSHRLHDRFLYAKANGEWLFTRLSP